MTEERRCLVCRTWTVYPEDIEFLDTNGQCRACGLEERITEFIRKERGRKHERASVDDHQSV